MFSALKFGSMGFLCLWCCVCCVSVVRGADARATDVTNAIDKAMTWLRGKEHVGAPQYSDYVVFCGLSVAHAFPQHTDVIQSYKRWITENDVLVGGYLYHSACHVMALGLIGELDPALTIFTTSVEPSGSHGAWDTSGMPDAEKIGAGTVGKWRKDEYWH